MKETEKEKKTNRREIKVYEQSEKEKDMSV